jgi:hypothetical protein
MSILSFFNIFDLCWWLLKWLIDQVTVLAYIYINSYSLYTIWLIYNIYRTNQYIRRTNKATMFVYFFSTKVSFSNIWFNTFRIYLLENEKPKSIKSFSRNQKINFGFLKGCCCCSWSRPIFYAYNSRREYRVLNTQRRRYSQGDQPAAVDLI